MDTQEIISEINKMTLSSSEDYDNLDRIDQLTAQLRKNQDGYLACEAMINLLERHPNVEFGTPGEPVHTIEKFEEYYEPFLYESLKKYPTGMTTWMLNRIINVTKEDDKREQLLSLMKSITEHPLASKNTKESALHFYKYQTEE